MEDFPVRLKPIIIMGCGDGDMDKFNIKLFNTICQEIIDKELSKKEAVQKLSDILNNYSIEEINKEPAKFDLRANIEKFLDEKERQGLRKNTIDSYKLQLNLFIDFIGEKKSVQDITKDDIKQFLYFREDTSDINSKRTLETIRSILKVFFDWLKEEERIQFNPITKIKPYRFSDAVIDYLDPEELNKIRSACKTIREKALVEVLASTGCMLSEICELELDDINWGTKVLNIRGLNERNRIVLLSDEALKLLRDYINSRKDDCNFVFVTARNPYRKMSSRAIQREIGIIAKRTNIKKDISPKIFRHTFAKSMLNKGCPLNIVQTLLGYKDYTISSETNVRITKDNINIIFEKFVQ